MRKIKVIKNNSGFALGLYDWLKWIMVSIVVASVFLMCFKIVRVDGVSMNSTLENNDYVILTDIFYTPKTGDIVVANNLENYDKPIIKRVIATEGQTLKLDYENRRVIVDEVILNEPYINENITFGNPVVNYDIPEVIPEGKVFVMGDNRSHSMDSRDERIGLIDKDKILGKAQVIALPIDRFGYLYE